MDGEENRYEILFEPDGFGSLRDIYVRDTVAQDWQKVLDFLRQHRFNLDYRVNGVSAPLPDSVSELFTVWDRAAPALFVDIDGVRVASYFFDESEIEFDLDPRDVVRPDQADRILAFVQDLADVVGKPAILTPENHPEDPLVRKEPAAQTVR